MRIVRERPMMTRIRTLIKEAESATVTQRLPKINYVALSRKEWDDFVRELNAKNGNTNDVPTSVGHLWFEGTCIRREG